jgi:cell division protein FtsB
MKHTIIDNRTEINRLKAENARLKAEVERLTKAGDAMADELIRLEAAFNNIESAEAQMWYIAKEGGCP